MNSNDIYSKLSPFAETIYDNLNENRQFNYDEYLIRTIDSTHYVSCLLISNTKLNNNFFDKYNLIKGASIKNYYSLKVPLENYLDFCKDRRLKYIQADEPVSLLLDNANQSTNFISANTQLRNSQFFESSGVVVGVIDIGFQLNHVMFKNSNGNTRIRKAWFQGTSSPTTPSKFNYGTEILPSDIGRFLFDTQYDSHGSHVAGIAAGSNFPNSDITGVASEADIILVSPNFYDTQLQATSQTDIVDGVAYIFDEASRLGKPCVINLSLGTQLGPHDGSALFDVMCAELQNSVAYGRSLVTAAGNDGERNITIKNNFSSSNDTLKTAFYLYNSNLTQYIDIWGKENSEICVSLGYSQGSNIIWDSNVFCTNKSGTQSGVITNSNSNLYNYTISQSPEEAINGKSRIFLQLNSRRNSDQVVALKITSDDEVILWNSLFGGSQGDYFYSFGKLDFTGGQNDFQIGEIGGNNEDFITVASYNTKNSFRSLNNNLVSLDQDLLDLSLFSSIGPNAESKMKPDITAPGSIVISALNGFDQSLDSNTIAGFDNSFSTSSYIGPQTGTSMSSPIVAGTVALMLRANPYLNQSEIKQILKETAYQDEFTGIINEAGTTNWGAGKLDSYKAVERAEELSDMIDLFPEILYTNPFDERLKVKFNLTPTTKNEYYLVDAMGKIKSNGNFDIDDENFQLEVNTTSLKSGVYFLRLVTDRFERTIPLIKLNDAINNNFYKF
ncbi:S8 family peptidase [Candidatus Kapabacteria bacterium]|nr:S8 family peptidase [Candidatus Kapabacteria bacterium]